MDQIADQDIIRRVRDGDIDSFSYIVKKYHRAIHSYVYKTLFNKEDVDDLVQNSFLSLYKSMNRFDENRPILPYLFQIVRNELKMYFRAHKKTVQLNDTLPAGDNNYDWQIDEREAWMKSLSMEEKTALESLVDGFSYREIANKLQKPLNTVKSLVRRARLKVIKNNSL